MSIVKSLSVGNGDMFYIVHNTDSFTIIDCCMDDSNKSRIVKELKAQSKGKGITRFISTHPDDDHIRGLTYLHQQMPVFNFYCAKNDATKEEVTDDFKQYCALRDDPKKVYFLYRGCTRQWLNEKNEERGGAGIGILWPDPDNKQYLEALSAAAQGESANNISAIIKYSLENGVTVLWMGDLETDFMDKLDPVPVGRSDIVFAPHHGRDSGKVPASWLEKMNPTLIIIGEAPAEHLNYYAGYNTITQNSAGDIILQCEQGKTHIFVSEIDYSVDFLYDERVGDRPDGFYLGTLQV